MPGIRSSVFLTAAYVLWACSANAQSFDWSDADAQQLSETVSSGQYGRITSVWIEQNGAVIYEDYFSEAERDTLHNMRSAGKTVTGLLVGIAIDNGLIDGVDTKAATEFMSYPNFIWWSCSPNRIFVTAKRTRNLTAFSLTKSLLA